jgi:gas vesicle protein
MASGETKKKTRETAQQAQQKGQEVVAQGQQQVQEKAEQVKGQARDRLRTELDRRSTQAGEQAQAVGGALRRTADELRKEGTQTHAKVADQAADKVDQLAGYLRDANAERILSDIENAARRRPWVAGSIGALAGFLASRFLKASSSRRYESRQRPETYTSADELGYPPLPPIPELEAPVGRRGTRGV